MIKRHRKKIIVFSFCSFLLLLIISQFHLKTSGKLDASKTEKRVAKAKKIKRAKDSLVSTKSTFEAINELVQKAHRKKDFNGSVLVAKKGAVLYQEHFGAVSPKDQKIDDNSAFQLASVSKQFTAVAVMLLVDRGQLGVDDSLICYYPKFPYKNVTVRQLLNHTSGLPMYFWLAEHQWKEKEPPTNTEMMDMLIEYKLPPFFYPGRRFDYSNTGYFVLASLVEKVSGISFKKFIEQNIFFPLEMHNSFVYQYYQDTLKPNQLVGYRRRGRRRYEIGGTVNDRIVGDKNIYSTANDLFKWVKALNSGQLISKNALHLMYEKGKTNSGRSVPYGFGFRISDKNGEGLIYHNGTWNGFRTTIRQYMKEEIVVIILEHTSYKGISSLAKKIRHAVNENYCID